MGKSSTGGKRVLIYVNQVYPDEGTGQGTFERDLIPALREQARRAGAGMEVITVRRPGAGPADAAPAADTTALVLDRSGPLGYLGHQIRLFFALLAALLRHRRDEVVIYTRYSVSSLAPVALATVFRRRLVIRTGPALTNLEIHEKHPNWVALQAIRLSFWWNCRRAAAIVVVTRQIQSYVEGLYRFARGKTVIVHNGVNPARFPACRRDRARWGLEESGLVLGFVGHIYEDQGLDTVIRAIGRIEAEAGRAPQMLVVGDGPCLGPWKALARQLEVETRVVFAGRQPHGEVASAIAACDVMLAPFTKRAFAVTGSSAIKLFEYLACDKPVLASDGEDHRFLVDHRVGWLVEPEDVDAWTRAIREREHDAGCGLEGRGRRLVEEEYGFAWVAERIWQACFEGPVGRPAGALLKKVEL